MSTGSLDANVILRLIIGDVPQQREQALRLLSRGVFWVSDIVVAEVGYVLTRGYGFDRTQAYTLLASVLGEPNLTCAGHALVALEAWASKPKLSLEDCLLVAQTEAEQKGPLWTFDRKLANQSAARLVG